MRSRNFLIIIALLATLSACWRGETRGVADKRSDYRNFLPMKQDAARDGLKSVKPYLRRADRTEIIRAIDRACDGRRSGSSVYDPRTEAGYYVNCNPRNRHLLTGYVPLSPSEQPHSR
jgi:hypothetical protein